MAMPGLNSAEVHTNFSSPQNLTIFFSSPHNLTIISILNIIVHHTSVGVCFVCKAKVVISFQALYDDMSL